MGLREGHYSQADDMCCRLYFITLFVAECIFYHAYYVYYRCYACDCPPWSSDAMGRIVFWSRIVNFDPKLKPNEYLATVRRTKEGATGRPRKATTQNCQSLSGAAGVFSDGAPIHTHVVISLKWDVHATILWEHSL